MSSRNRPQVDSRPDSAGNDPLVATGISKSFGTVKALDDVTMRVHPNEVLGLIGENGAGKSTLLKMLAGIHKADAGELQINGIATTLRSPADAARHGIAVVHQEQSLLTNLSVAENIHMAVQAGGSAGRSGVRFGIYDWPKIYAVAEKALKRVGAEVDPKAKVSTLSFAQRQMVEIAKAVEIAEDPTRAPLIILDEPTSVLESDDVDQLEREMIRLKALGSIIFVSHRLDEVLRMCDRIYVMRDGRVVAERLTADVDDTELFALMTGREQIESRWEAERTDVEVLRADNVSAEGYSDISLTVHEGEVHSVLGVKDSGREEFMRDIFGLADKKRTGTVSVAGRRLRGRSVAEATRAGVAYLPSERKTEGMIGGLSVSENITLTNSGGSRIGPFLRLRKQKEVAQEWIARLEIRPDDPNADIARLSGGNQQKVVLSKWLLAADLKLLLLDHPTRGVDPGAREKVYEAVAAARQRGVAVLMLADTLEEALGVSDRITVMRDGEISATYDLRSSTPSMAELIGKMV